MEKEAIRDIIQNKNLMMFLTSMIFMGGILACFYGFAIFYCGLVTLLLIVCMYLRFFSIRKTLLLILIFYLGFFVTFFKIKNYDRLLQVVPADVNISGRVVNIPTSGYNTKVKFFMQAQKLGDEELNAKTFVTVSGEEDISKLYNIGEKVSIKGKLRKPFTATNPSQFDYSKYLRNFNIFTTLYAKSSDVDIVSDNPSFRWKFLKALNNTRNRVLAVHSKYLKSPNLEVLGGIVFGDDAVSPPEYIKNSFINSGLLHILAASGMNVAFIYTFWFFILKFWGVPFKPRVLSGMLVVILYTLMTGLGASVIRAALMLLFVLAGKLIDRDAHSVSLLSLVAVIMLIYNPAYINDVSFQLSFLVTFGLLTTANILASKLEKIPNWIKIPVLIPIVAQLWVAPIQMFYFNTFSLYSVFANIATVSLLSVISFCGFVSSVISIIPPFADITCRVFDFFLNYLLNILIFISDFFAGMKYCLIQTTHPSIFQLGLYYVMLLGSTCLIKFNKYKYCAILVFIISLTLGATTLKPMSKNLEIIAFDVQNADSFLIKTPENKYFMIDTGKSPYDSGNSQAKIIMLKYLKDRGIKNLEGVIVTHFDNDHSGGAADIIASTKTKTLYLNSTKADTATAKRIFATSKAIGQNYVIAQNNNEIYSEKDLSIKTFMADIKGKDESNGCSIITLLSYKDFDMLFMGDAGIEPFNQIKKDIPHKVEVLKVGHHGGPRVVDNDMLDHLDTKVSLISTGINYFGHPNKGTLDVLRNTEILRTDLHHSVKISTDGSEYKIYTYDTHDKNYRLKSGFNAE
ncbi:MAG: DNA internalization-related competence protein ComEC/Rec2 [Muribaculaceae bacterium]|nr:DNA internalization-related competence protein ComEC/Rec2 [Muribaculaceae bacterium]